MKTLFKLILLTGACLSVAAWADIPNYDTASRIISFPKITVDLDDAYINAQLRLNLDGTWEILAIEPDPAPNLTGEWSGNSSGIMFPDFIPGISCIADLRISLFQNGNQVTGEGAFVNGCHNEESGNIIGMINDNNISFDLILGDEMVLHYVGTISSDTYTLMGDYSSIDFDESGTWKLSLQ